VYVAFQAGGSIFLARSTDGGQTFDQPHFVDSIAFPFSSGDFSGGSGRDCGDKPFVCASGLTFSRFESYPTVAADRHGVHVAWNDRLQAGRNGQSKIFVRSSADGMSWSGSSAPVDTVEAGHQYFPDMAASGGVVTLVFYDSRADPSYDPFGPPGETKKGKSSGPAVDTYAATSNDGGLTWQERRVSARSSNYNIEVPGPIPFWGDYIYVSAAGGIVVVAWTDSRDVVLSNEGTGGKDGFDPYEPCFLDGRYINDPCLSRGGHDQNIYAARL
jgi:hypothetical protein